MIYHENMNVACLHAQDPRKIDLIFVRRKAGSVSPLISGGWQIAHVREQVDSAFREARVKVWNLRSHALDGQPLEAALREFVERTAPSIQARCSVAVSGEPRPCSPETEEELLRIAQEAVNNAGRHAQASEIRLALEFGARSLTLSIFDNGTGFDFDEGFAKPGHWGLKNMLERAVVYGNSIEITADHLPAHVFKGAHSSHALISLEQLEREYIATVLDVMHGRKSETARILGISRKTLLEKRKRYNLD